MAKKDALRALGRRLPTPPEFREILDSLHEQTDLAIAVIGAATLESILEKLIAKSLPSLTPVLEGSIFKNRGPLSDFESKVLIAVALSIIPQGFAEKINCIRKIRNTFAHATVPISFETPAVSNEISDTLKPYVLRAYKIIHEKPMEEDPTNARVFVSSIRVIGYLMDETHEALTGQRFLFDLTSQEK
jgi:hypothetical protein